MEQGGLILEVAYINMLINAGMDPKTIQEPARYSSLDITTLYTRPVEARLTRGVEKGGEMILNASLTITGPEQEPGGELNKKNATSVINGGCIKNFWCREWDLNPHDLAATGF